MAKVWLITGSDGDQTTFKGEMPGQMSESEVSTALERLAARHLSEDEIISASLRKRTPGYRPLLEPIGTGRPISYGHGVNYTADFKDK